MTDLETLMEEHHWADKIAAKLIKIHPEVKKFVCAAGISPSGVVHIGNFRDIITSELVYRALKDKGYDAELIFSWDDFDRLRKVPQGIPESFSQYLGMPLSEIPDPYKCHASYAEHFEADFEEAVPQLGIKARFIRQSKQYGKNMYYEEIKIAMQKRREIDKILAKFRTKDVKTAKDTGDNYYPLQVYCSECRKSTTTKITHYDGEDKITYSCSCGHSETVDIFKRNIGKLEWKVDWAMRWKYECVAFEPGGEDHATPGGSYSVAKIIADKIFEIKPPYFQGYGFIGVEGISKMSGSKGTGITPKELLRIYEPELLRWLFTRANPERALTLFFSSEIIRQYDEFDRAVVAYHEKNLSLQEKRAIDFARLAQNKPLPKAMPPFRQAASFGQVVQGNFRELKKIYERLGETYDDAMLKQRLEKSQNWVARFAPELMIKVRGEPNSCYYYRLTNEEKEQIDTLRDGMTNHWDLQDLTSFVYNIPKKAGMSEDDKKKAQRNFFKNVYQLLIGTGTGPRLPIFLLALGKDRARKLLSYQ